MTWLKACAWIMVAATVVVVLGGYLYQWYRDKVSSSLDHMLGAARTTDEPVDGALEPQVVVASGRDVTSEEQELLALDTGYVED